MKYKLIIACIATIGFIIAACIFANAYKYKFKIGETINVTGNAKKDFESDIVKWSADFSKKSLNLSDASEELKRDRELVKNFLIQRGIKENEIVFDAVNITRDFSYHTDANGNSYNTFTGFSLSQSVSIESKDLDKVEVASREISALISQGVELSSKQPNYYYSKLEDLKLSLIAEASKNAKSRAENIANESSVSLGSLKKADLGIFQITG